MFRKQFKSAKLDYTNGQSCGESISIRIADQRKLYGEGGLKQGG